MHPRVLRGEVERDLDDPGELLDCFEWLIRVMNAYLPEINDS